MKKIVILSAIEIIATIGGTQEGFFISSAIAL
jgi:hypothetical protein